MVTETTISKDNNKHFCCICGVPCYGWTKLSEDEYYCIECDPVDDPELKELFKNIEAYFLLTFCFIPDESKVQ